MKRFERSNGLDTALYKNYLYLFCKSSVWTRWTSQTVISFNSEDACTGRRCNLGWYVKRRVPFEVARTCTTKGRCRLCETMHHVSGGMEGACQQAEDGLEHSVCRHSSADSRPPGRQRQSAMEGHRTA